MKNDNDNPDETRITADLPSLQLEMRHRPASHGAPEVITVTMTGMPDFDRALAQTFGGFGLLPPQEIAQAMARLTPVPLGFLAGPAGGGAGAPMVSFAFGPFLTPWLNTMRMMNEAAATMVSSTVFGPIMSAMMEAWTPHSFAPSRPKQTAMVEPFAYDPFGVFKAFNPWASYWTGSR
ncbi:MAG: hypothetical protein AAGF19_00880 [Pseudomonadota bacterium]